MPFSRHIQRLLLGMMVACAIIILSAAYWSVFGSDTLLLREDNPRLFEAQASIVRGEIRDRRDELLVQSIQAENGWVSRDYLYPETNGFLGYYSLQYGVGGIEGMYNEILRGDDLERDFGTYLSQDLIHLPQQGSDIQLTLDLEIQRAVHESMGDHTGAAVVLSAANGEILAMLSLPTYDPNQLDENWKTLIDDPRDPFYQRVLQGNYQPGGMLQTPLVTAAILADYPVNTRAPGGSADVRTGGVMISCATRAPADNISLGEAYGFGCPAHFDTLYQFLGPYTVESILAQFQLYDSPFILDGFVSEPGDDVVRFIPTPPVDDGLASAEQHRADALGQGDILVTPMTMAAITAAMINNGNAPRPYTLLARRLPGETTWQPVNQNLPTIPITTAETSRRVQQLMRNATVTGGARDAARSGINVGGHIALAYAGDSTLSWFVGFVITGPNQGVAIALVLEDEDDPREAATIGGQILESAYNRMIGTGRD